MGEEAPWSPADVRYSARREVRGGVVGQVLRGDHAGSSCPITVRIQWMVYCPATDVRIATRVVALVYAFTVVMISTAWTKRVPKFSSHLNSRTHVILLFYISTSL